MTKYFLPSSGFSWASPTSHRKSFVRFIMGPLRHCDEIYRRRVTCNIANTVVTNATEFYFNRCFISPTLAWNFLSDQYHQDFVSWWDFAPMSTKVFIVGGGIAYFLPKFGNLGRLCEDIFKFMFTSGQNRLARAFACIFDFI